MILTHDSIINLIQKKKVVITPFDPLCVGPASIDLTLDGEIRVFVKKHKNIDVTSIVDYKKYTAPKKIPSGYLLQPGELILGITKETITLPSNVCGLLQSRSRFARVGLMSHITAPFVSPGVSNRQVLEIFNAGPVPLRIHPGVKICHIILVKCDGDAIYHGQYMHQTLR
jgi:dCTP deaminase